jgi:hypothetical protein
MKDSLFGFAIFGAYIGIFVTWIYGVAAAFDNGNTFMAVLNFVIPPIGFIYGLIDLLF